MNTAIVTKASLEQARQAAIDGYMRAYGQAHDRPFGKFCYMGWIDRAYAMAAEATDEVSKKRMEKAIGSIIGMAERDFIVSEKMHADYVDMCNGLGVTPQPIEPNCQCEYCRRIPNGAELLFAVGPAWDKFEPEDED